MQPSFTKMNVLLGKVQSAIGTKQSSLVNTDMLTVGDDFSLDYKKEFIETNFAEGFFGNQQRIGGSSTVDVKVSMPVIPTGSTTPSNIDIFLQASGTAQVTATNQITYTPSSTIATDYKDLTLWGYSGDKVSGDSLLTKAHSAMFDCELSFEVGKPFMATFTGKAVPDGAPAAGTYVSGALALLSSIAPAVLKSTVMKVNDATLSILKGSIKFGNDVQYVKSAADDSGNLHTMITGRKTTFSVTVYQTDLSTAANNPFTGMAAGTLADTELTFGTAGSRISWKTGTDKSEIIGCKPGNDNGLNTFEIEGSVVGNSWSLLINAA